MWTKTKSLFLSRVLVYVSAAIGFIATFFVPSIADWYDEITVGSGLIGGSVRIPTIVGLYVCEVLAFAILWSLNKLLANIDRSEVFIPENTVCLRRISWGFMFVGFTFIVMGLWRSVFFIPATAAVMFGLVMRVLKNVFEKAVEIKSENDFTI
ncbi:MAG: DUF2975 domain-containing protein [Ruminococcus sp.]|nr:DUF2975 domain-containing protein [Ruminococcus sp.]